MAKKNLNKGIFITFEGPEGSGKSTHSNLLCDYLKSKGFPLIHTREPGGTSIGEKIRHIVLDAKYTRVSPYCEMFLYMAARTQLVKDVIHPALKKGWIVICDRFMDATFAYQGYGAKLDITTINKIANYATYGIKPDLTFLLDIDTVRGLKRAGKTKDRIERKSLTYHRRVRSGYLKLAKQNPKRIKVIAANSHKEKVQKLIKEIVMEKLRCP